MKAGKLALLAGMMIPFEAMPRFDLPASVTKYPGDGAGGRHRSTISTKERKKRTSKKRTARKSRKQNKRK